MKNLEKKCLLPLISRLLANFILSSEVNIYTSRHYDADDELYEKFTKNTGIKVNIISGSGSALMERLKLKVKTHPVMFFLLWMQGIYQDFKRKAFFKL